MNITNNVTLMGRIVKDPVYFNNANGSQTVRMTLAVQRTYKDANGKYGTDFIPLQGYIANPAQRGVYAYLAEGRQILVGGHISSYAAPDKTDATKTAYGININIDGIQLLESKAVIAAREAAQPASAQAPVQAPVAPVAAPVAQAPAYVADEFEGVL